jgi:hypothetical protein
VPDELSPRRIAEHQAALRDFNDAYVEYLQGGPDAPNGAELRNRVIALIPRAQAALNAAGVRLWVSSPPATPRQIVYDNLASVAFLHESFGLFDEVPKHVPDSVRVASATLMEKDTALQRERRRPLYWLDRAVSAFLRFPSYIVAKLVGVPTWRIENSTWGMLLRIGELAATALGVYWGGSAAGWW